MLIYVINIFVLLKKLVIVLDFRHHRNVSKTSNFIWSKHIKYLMPGNILSKLSFCYSSQKYVHLSIKSRIIFISWSNIMFYIILQVAHKKIWHVTQWQTLTQYTLPKILLEEKNVVTVSPSVFFPLHYS